MNFLEGMFGSPAHSEDSDFLPIFPLNEDSEEDFDEDFSEILAILVLKNTVLFPSIVIPITVGREKSIRAITHAYQQDRFIGVLSQRDSEEENPEWDDLYRIGTIARIMKIIKMPDGSLTAFLQGRRRFEGLVRVSEEPFISCTYALLDTATTTNEEELEAFATTIKEQAQRIIELSPNIPSEANIMLRNIDKKSFLLNFIASNLNVHISIKQRILEQDDLVEKAKLVLEHLTQELQVLELKDHIESRVRNDMEKQQRDYFLNQQLKTIQEELGGNPQEEELNALETRAETKRWSETIAAVFKKELTKARRTNPAQPEYSLLLNYLETLLELPWDECSTDNFDLADAKNILDRDHFGMEKIKERVLEHLAVLKLRGDMKAPILCLVGPPGVGKTSLGKSIATALERKYVRISLGGLHDESEIRGHRKTYIGALPGRIIQSLKKAGTSNPVFILDEIDKIGRDFRGDPSSALLEVLDPEQNNSFYDNYLEIEYDLSKVMFIATANTLSSVQPALLDRMEIVQLSGYSVEEKIEIAHRHLVPKQLKEHGLNDRQVVLEPHVLETVIQHYTRESGVRNLDRQIATVMRHFAVKVASDVPYNPVPTPPEIEQVLGTRQFTNEVYQEPLPAGVAVGLAWTSVGGDILFIEVSLHKGNGRLTLTGNLGDVMKESATTALSYLKANAAFVHIPLEKFAEQDIHIHIPEGAIPKDGPSAGITMLSALASAFTDRPLKPHLAMTGEITLRGKVLPVGGIKEKILAAKRAFIKEVVLCRENEAHLREIAPEYIKEMNFVYVKTMKEVLEYALMPA